jgi:two-component system chemotaxis response regulator CheB
MRAAGAWTIAQDRDSSVVWGMPRVAFEAGACSEVLPLDDIAPRLASLLPSDGGKS